jgi:hypothetical protein
MGLPPYTVVFQASHGAFSIQHCLTRLRLQVTVTRSLDPVTVFNTVTRTPSPQSSSISTSVRAYFYLPNWEDLTFELLYFIGELDANVFVGKFLSNPAK